VHKMQRLSSILAVRHVPMIPPYSFGHFAIVTVTRHVIPREQLELVRYLVLTEEEVRLGSVVRVTSRPNTDNSEGECEETEYRARNIDIVDVRAARVVHTHIPKLFGISCPR